MRLILPILLALIGIGVGGGVAYMYKSAQLEKQAEMKGEKDGEKSKGDKDGYGDAKDGQDEDAKDKKKEAAEDSEYLPLSRKLIVPFVRANGRKAYVVVDVTLEIGPGETPFAETHEPKIIDAFLRTLISFAATGAFEDPTTASETLDELNAELYKAAKAVLGDRVRGVLIANLITQDA